MARYGLIGGDPAHGRSPQIHSLLGDYGYDIIDLKDASGLADLLGDTSYDGFTVSAPYMTQVMRYLDEISDEASAAGYVNTVKRLPDGKLRGYNTDVYAFRRFAEGSVEGKKCLLLGMGATALGVAEVLTELGAASVVLVSEDPDADRERIGDRFEIAGWSRLYPYYDSEVMINCTSCGQYPEIEHSPLTDRRLSVRLFSRLELAVDLIYNPYRTKFLQDARRLTGCRTKSGLDMLIMHTVRSRGIWLDMTSDPDEEQRYLTHIKRMLLGEQLNIVAVGMPGSGKTTIFRRFAYELGMEFLDTDEEAERIMGDKAENVLAAGETGIDTYRAAESQAVREACRHNGAVIATGGGTVLDPINRDLLRSNGIVVYVRRPLEMLEVKGRPISISRGVAELFGERDRIYRRVADLQILNARVFGGELKLTGKGNTYNYELKGFVYYIARKIERYLNEIADNKWT